MAEEEAPISPIFPLESTGYVDMVWFVGGIPQLDLLAMLWKERAEGPLQARVRTRIHNSPDPWDNEDRKTVMDLSRHLDEDDPTFRERVITNMREILAQIKAMFAKDDITVETWELMVNGGPEALFEAFKQLPFAHTKTIDKEEAKES